MSQTSQATKRSQVVIVKPSACLFAVICTGAYYLVTTVIADWTASDCEIPVSGETMAQISWTAHGSKESCRSGQHEYAGSLEVMHDPQSLQQVLFLRRDASS